jgi:hypothetical protein
MTAAHMHRSVRRMWVLHRTSRFCATPILELQDACAMHDKNCCPLVVCCCCCCCCRCCIFRFGPQVEALLDRCHGGPPLVSWVVSQLEGLGYRSWAHRVVSSAGFGVPNRRRRIFILASMHGDARDVLLGQVGFGRAEGSLASVLH